MLKNYIPDAVCEAPRCEPINKNITNDLASISCALTQIEIVVETILCKIDGGVENSACSGKEPEYISELLEHMKIKSERIFHRIDQINNFI